MDNAKLPQYAVENPFGIEPELFQHLSRTKEGLIHRLMAYDVYRQIPMPTKKDRAWRKTSIEEFNAKDYRFQPQTGDRSSCKIHVEKKEDEIIIHYQPNKVENNIRNELEKAGIFIYSLLEAEEKHPQLLDGIAGKIVSPVESKFSAFTQMMDTDGILIRLAKGKKVETPIHITIEDDQSNKSSTFHLMIILEEDSAATILNEWNESKKDAVRMLAGVVEIRMEKNAYLVLNEMQTWPDQQWTFLHERAELHENSRLDWSVYAEGGKYSRTFLGIDLAGAQSQARITGICLNANPTQLDFDTFQLHRATETTSDLLFNGAMGNDSRSIWRGMIRVEKDAVKTDAYQANRNLILCGDPLVESIPGLEILTDDVRCSHGVSAGEIDAEQLFYLASRGIPEKEAKRVIAQGFLNSGMERIGNATIREKIEEKIHSGLEGLFCE